MWRQLDPGSDTVSVEIDGQLYAVPYGISLAAALLYLDLLPTRCSDVAATPRAPYCMMGVCFECRMRVDGKDARRACLVTVTDGMRVDRHVADGVNET